MSLPTPEHSESSQASQATVLAVEGLSKSYDSVRAVDRLSLNVASGDILGLVGPNGAGKTTTLRSIAGVLPIESGRIVIDGFDIEREPRQAKGSMAWVPEDPAPFDSLTVEEQLEFTAALYRVRDWRARGDELLERFELSAKRDALGGELSRGMRQKLAFCCAWLPQPKLVLLDEPLSGLDPRGIRAAKQAIVSLAAEGTAVLLSSHLLSLIEELCTRLLIVDGGRGVFQGTLAEARSAVEVAAGSSLEDVFFAATGPTGVADPVPGQDSAEGNEG